MAGFSDLFGEGSTARQLLEWSVLNQVIGAVANPALVAITRKVNEAAPIIDISVSDAALAVVRHVITVDDGLLIAHRNGLDDEQFRRMVALSGDAPAPQALAEALRRKLIEEHGTGAGSTSFEQGISETRLANKWTELVKDLAVQWPTPADALDALLEGQIDDATGRELYARFGGDPQFFTMLYNTRGNAPTPQEALTLANRNIIPWEGTGPDSVSYEQAFLEGPWRNKWEKPFRALGEYLPPPRTVTAMYHEGALDKAKAIELLQKQGLTAELAAAYVDSGSSRKTADDRKLTMGEVIGLYQAKIISPDDARNLLGALRYSSEEADYLLQMADLRRAMAAVNTAVSRLHSLFVGHKIGKATAASNLTELGVPAAQASELIQTWQLEAAANVRLPSEAQIVDAFHEQLIDQGEAQARLVHMGYSPYDAWLLLSLKEKKPLPGKPAEGPAPVPGMD